MDFEGDKLSDHRPSKDSFSKKIKQNIPSEALSYSYCNIKRVLRKFQKLLLIKYDYYPRISEKQYNQL